jgi:multidrug efflux pump
MRRSLGTAVFSGMLGVTLFGIFLTPVFFSVIQGLGESKPFAPFRDSVAISSALGVLLGLVGGYLLARLEALPLLWALPIGGFAGFFGVLAVVGIHHLSGHGTGAKGQEDQPPPGS